MDKKAGDIETTSPGLMLVLLVVVVFTHCLLQPENVLLGSLVSFGELPVIFFQFLCAGNIFEHRLHFFHKLGILNRLLTELFLCQNRQLHCLAVTNPVRVALGLWNIAHSMTIGDDGRRR